MNGVNYGELNKGTDVWALGATVSYSVPEHNDHTAER